MTALLKSRKFYVLVSAIIALLASGGAFAYAQNALAGGISITVVGQPVYLSDALIAPSGSCSIQNSGESLTCTIPSMVIYSNGTLTVTLCNPITSPATTISIAYKSLSNVLTTTNSIPPFTLQTAQNQTVTFDFQAASLGAGSLEIAITAS